MRILRNLRDILKPFWLKVELLHAYAKPPTRNSEFAAGYDVHAVEPQGLYPGLNKVKLGFRAAFPSGWAAQVWDRSSMGSAGFIRHAGLLDSDYRGEWMILLYNHTDKVKSIEPGDRIAQIVFTRVAQEPAEIVNQLPESKRGSGGFGSTGR